MRRGVIHEKGDDQPEGELEASGMVAEEGELEASGMVAEEGELEASGMVAEEGELEASGMVSTIFYLGFHILCNIKETLDSKRGHSYIGVTSTQNRKDTSLVENELSELKYLRGYRPLVSCIQWPFG